MGKIRQVCIIDDDEILVFIVQRLFKQADICSNFLMFENGSEALAGLQEIKSRNQIRPDLILLDLNMPVMGGWEFLSKLPDLEITDLPPIFIMTSSIDPRDAEKAKKLDIVSEYIVKPLEEKRIKKLIARNIK